jgi:hypothetical protein
MSNKYFHKVLIPDGGVAGTIYTVPAANTGILRSLRVTNAGSSSSAVTVIQYDAGSSTPHYLLKGKSLPINATIDVFNGVPCVVEAGDEVEILSTADDVSFYLSYLELDRN